MDGQQLYMISCDWFQYFCVSGFRYPQYNCYYQGKRANPRGYVSQYYIKGCSEKLPGYKCHAGIYLHDYLLCVVSWSPTNRNVRRDGAAVKVNNRLLYTSEWNFYVHDVIDAIGWSIKNITRIDLCYDCNLFHGGLHPQALIQSYINPQFADLKASDSDVEVITKKNVQKTVALAGRSFIRKGSNRFHVEGVKVLHSPIFEYLRFGSRKSAVCAYLYNKSQELRVKKSKPYISACWANVGLDTTEVYRVELSINSSGQWLRAKGEQTTGDATHNKVMGVDDFAFQRLDGRALATQERIEEMFFTYAAEYFAFHIDTGQQYVKDMPRVQLFEQSRAVTLKPVSINRFLDTGRAERMVANRLDKLQTEFPFLETDQRKTVYDAANIFAQIAGLKLAKRKQDEWQDKLLLPQIDAKLWIQMRKYLDLRGDRYKNPRDIVSKIRRYMDEGAVFLVSEDSKNANKLES